MGLHPIEYDKDPLVASSKLSKLGELEIPFDYVCSSSKGGKKGGNALKATHGVQHFKRITSVHDDADDTHYHVNLRYKTCTCNMFQEWEIPCKHAIAVCKRRNLDPLVLVGNNWKLEMYSI